MIQNARNFATRYIEERTESDNSQSLTVEEILAIPYDGGDRELIRGELREYRDGPNEFVTTSRSRWHSRVEGHGAQCINNLLDKQPEPRGELDCGEAGPRLVGTKDSLVGIDVRLSRGNAGTHIPELGDLQRPTLSRHRDPLIFRHLERIADKVNLYLESGVTTWVVNPEFRTISVHRPGQEVVVYNREAELPGDPELPEFRLKLAELFPA